MSSWHCAQIPRRLPEVLLPSELSHWPYRQLSSPGFKQKSQLWTLWSWLTFSKPQLWQNPVVFIIKTFGWYQIAGMPLLYITFLGRCWGHRGKWSRVRALFGPAGSRDCHRIYSISEVNAKTLLWVVWGRHLPLMSSQPTSVVVSVLELTLPALPLSNLSPSL